MTSAHQTAKHHSVNEGASDLLRSCSEQSVEHALDLLGSSVQGLTKEESQRRLLLYGQNTPELKQAPSWFHQLVRSFLFPFNAVLAGIIVVSLISDVALSVEGAPDYKTVSVLGTMILLSSLLRFWQEFRSSRAAEALKKMIQTTTSVLREGQSMEVHLEDVVPGDCILLSAGDLIPADCRVLRSKDLFLSESLLSGESLPVEKSASACTRSRTPVQERANLCFMGSTVASGSATVLVVNTGRNCLLSDISSELDSSANESSFDRDVRSLSYVLMRYMMIMVPLVFLVNGLTKQNWTDALLFAVSVAVGLTPEMLPMIVSTNLARGAVIMSRKRVIVKRLSAIQNIGAMDVLCTDKTGTLTLDKIVLKRALNVYGEEDPEVLQWAYLNAYHQTGLRSVMDKAVLEHEEIRSTHKIDERFRKVDELPFDFERRRMSVVLEQSNGKHLLICKGAVEEMLAICSAAFDPGDDRLLQIQEDRVIPLDASMREAIQQRSRELNSDGLRVLIIAVREDERKELNYSLSDEKDLILAGFIGFLDPPKASAAQAIESLQQAGIELKVLTGDNEVVCARICRDLGIPADAVLLGSDIQTMSEEALQEALTRSSICAKLSPLQKQRIITCLQTAGHTVGFMGDGINDAAALKHADVGISVDTAVDIAKESADVILLDKDLQVLGSAVQVGRLTFGNIMKYIKMATSSNFGNMFSMIGASALLPFLPMRPIQILLQNLLYDFSQISIPWDRVDDEYTAKPRRWDAGDISRFMIHIGPLSSLFDFITFAVLFWIFAANTPKHQALFQSGWFVEGMLSQVLIVHVIRTTKIPFLQSRASRTMSSFSVVTVATALALPFSPLAPALHMQALPPWYLLWLCIILLCYCLLLQIVKSLYIRRYKQWL